MISLLLLCPRGAEVLDWMTLHELLDKVITLSSSAELSHVRRACEEFFLKPKGRPAGDGKRGTCYKYRKVVG